MGKFGGAWANLVGHGQIWWGMGKFGGAWANLVGHGQRLGTTALNLC